MPIPVIGERDGTVAGAPGNLGVIDTGEGKQRDAGVLQILQAKRTQLGREHGASPGVRAPVVRYKRSFPAWPEDVFAARLTIKMSRGGRQ